MKRGSPGQKREARWSAAVKKELVLRLLRGEPVHGVSREMAVPVYKLERWRNRALAGIESALRRSENDSLEANLEDAYRRINELALELEVLRNRRRTMCRSPGRASLVGTPAAEAEPFGNN